MTAGWQWRAIPTGAPPQRPVGALELFGVGVALMGDQRIASDPLIGLAQGNAGLLRQPDQTLPRPVHEPGVGRERHRLRLHRRVDDDARKVRGLGRAGAGRGRQALLYQRDELLLAHPLAPARQRRAVERRLVLEELLAAERLKYGFSTQRAHARPAMSRVGSGGCPALSE